MNWENSGPDPSPVSWSTQRTFFFRRDHSFFSTFSGSFVATPPALGLGFGVLKEEFSNGNHTPVHAHLKYWLISFYVVHNRSFIYVYQSKCNVLRIFRIRCPLYLSLISWDRYESQMNFKYNFYCILLQIVPVRPPPHKKRDDYTYVSFLPSFNKYCLNKSLM